MIRSVKVYENGMLKRSIISKTSEEINSEFEILETKSTTPNFELIKYKLELINKEKEVYHIDIHFSCNGSEYEFIEYTGYITKDISIVLDRITSI